MNKRDFLKVTAGLGATLGSLAPVAQAAEPKSTDTAPAQPQGGEAGVPQSYIDADTGHRVVRLSSKPHSSALYFNFPAFSPDGRWMVFNRDDGISLTDFNDLSEKNLHTGPLEAFGVSQAQPLVYARKRGESHGAEKQTPSEYFTIHMLTGEVKSVAKLERGSVGSVSADDTLMVGTYAYRDVPLQPGPKIPGTDGGYNANWPDGTPMTFADAKIYRMAQRLKAGVPMEVFTLNVATGERKVLVASDDWLNHVQFSPTDPGLILYCHEGPWNLVDRMWTIRTDGTQNQLVHKREMNDEVAGHEFFSASGDQILYDLQTPQGEVFWLASYNLKTGERLRYHVERNLWSVHYNISTDGKWFAGDGGDSEMVAHATDGKWIYLYTPVMISDPVVNTPDDPAMIKPGVLRGERLVNMKNHDYRVEPNLRFSTDGKWIIFKSNQFGPSHTFAVEVKKA